MRNGLNYKSLLFFAYALSFVLLISLNFNCKTKDIDTNLQLLSERINNKCPIIIDSKTVLLSTSVPCQKCFLYLYQLDFDSNTSNINEFVTNKKEFIINSVKTSKDMSYFKNNNITISYQYVDTKGNALTKIIISPEDYN